MKGEEIIIKSIEEHSEGIKIIKELAPSIITLSEKIKNCFKKEKKLLICGNGGSASDAQHFSSELTGFFEKKRKGLPALALTTDTSAITAIGNDYGFDNIFSRQVQAIGCEDDIILVISTSGNSQNILEAIKAARQKSMYVASLTGRGGGRVKNLADLSLNVNLNKTSRIQEMHILIIHLLSELIEYENE